MTKVSGLMEFIFQAEIMQEIKTELQFCPRKKKKQEESGAKQPKDSQEMFITRAKGPHIGINCVRALRKSSI